MAKEKKIKIRAETVKIEVHNADKEEICIKKKCGSKQRKC